MGSEINMAADMTITADSRCFNWRVDSAIRSRTPSMSNLGACPLPKFASVVNRAIRSRTPSMSNLATSPLQTFASTLDNVAPRFFILFELQTATHNFLLRSNIDRGGFGVAYKAKLADGHAVAIKRVRSYLDIKDPFTSELAFLSCLHHKHLAGLLGFLEETDKRLLMYEYM